MLFRGPIVSELELKWVEKSRPSSSKISFFSGIETPAKVRSVGNQSTIWKSWLFWFIGNLRFVDMIIVTALIPPSKKEPFVPYQSDKKLSLGFLKARVGH